MKDSNTKATQAVVILSGGLDSVAALFWAKRTYEDVRAVSFRYGQPAADAEMMSAGRAAQVAGVPRVELAIADALALRVGLLVGAPKHDPQHIGIDAANVPARNIVFEAIAAAHAATWFRAGMIDLVVGCNAEDAATFPDCNARVLDAMSTVLRMGSTRHITIVAPWLTKTKRYAIETIADDPEALDCVLRSWSCYAKSVLEPTGESK